MMTYDDLWEDSIHKLTMNDEITIGLKAELNIIAHNPLFVINLELLVVELSGNVYLELHMSSTSSLASLALTSPKASSDSSPARLSPGLIGARLPPYS